jgi:hypothetical protein
MILLLLAGKPELRLSAKHAALLVRPGAVRLEAPEASEQILVFDRRADGALVDVTRIAAYQSVPAGVVTVLPSGRVLPLRDGRANIQIQVAGRTASVPVEVRDLAAPRPVSFERDVVPVLSKAGCNAGACHGKAEGQNGFKLSVFGYDPGADHVAIAYDAGGRRALRAAPEQSLLLLKATGQIPHVGGPRLAKDSRWCARLLRWVAEGTRLDGAAADPIVAIAVEPDLVTLAAGGSQQLRVTARGARRQPHCVTAEAQYQSNNASIGTVDSDGLIRAASAPGEAAILVRYLGFTAVCRVTHPRPGGQFTRPAERTFIDARVWDKLARLRIAPSAPASDATFLRRVYLDTIGTLPTVAEARRFLADRAPDRRRRLVAALLDRAEYADYWAERWCDLLQVDKDTITPEAAVAMTRWVRGQIERNVPYDQFVRSILTARGSTQSESPAAFFQVQADPEKAARAMSQLFLGVRIECAQCHHHPFERWDQKDYYALAGFFTGVERKPVPGGDLKIVDQAGSDLKHPRSGLVVPTAALGAAPASFKAATERRRVLADWVTSRQNPYFTRVIVNRLWAHYFGRGLVEPVDDMRPTNPASNEPLLDELAGHLIALDYDLKAFTRTVLDSAVYQLDSASNEANRLDDQNCSHAPWKPIPAEVLLDAISQATGVPEEFNGWPAGYRAIQIWDNKLPSVFLEVFGRPTRQTVCACERATEPSIAQALHLMNSAVTARKLHDRRGRPAALAESTLGPDEILDELYLATLSRFPTGEERTLMRRAFTEARDRREAIEDVLWTLINTKEFVFNH